MPPAYIVVLHLEAVDLSSKFQTQYGTRATSGSFKKRKTLIAMTVLIVVSSTLKSITKYTNLKYQIVNYYCISDGTSIYKLIDTIVTTRTIVFQH